MANNRIKFNQEKVISKKETNKVDRHFNINKALSRKISALLLLTLICLALVLTLFTGWMAPKNQSFLDTNNKNMTVLALDKEKMDKNLEYQKTFNSLFKVVFGSINDVKVLRGSNYEVYTEEEQKKDFYNLTFEKLYKKEANYKFNFKGWLFTNREKQLKIDFSNYSTLFTTKENVDQILLTSNNKEDIKNYFLNNLEEVKKYNWYLVKDNKGDIKANIKAENLVDLSTKELVEKFDFSTDLYSVLK